MKRRAINMRLTDEQDVMIRNKESQSKTNLAVVARYLLMLWAQGEISGPVEPEIILPKLPKPVRPCMVERVPLSEGAEELREPEIHGPDYTLEDVMEGIDLSDVDDEEIEL